MIDRTTFFNRLTGFYAAWKADKRSGNAVFGGVGSIVILMGKTDEANSFQKNNAIHVCCISTLPYIHISCQDLNSDEYLSSGFSATSFQLHSWYSQPR